MKLRQFGNGENVFVGLHGWSGDANTFLPLLRQIPKDVTFFSLDLPGSGASPAPDTWRMDSFIKNIAADLSNNNIRNMTIVGNCIGGLFGLFLTKLLSESQSDVVIKKIVLIEPYAYFPWYFRAFVDPRLGPIGWYAYCTTFKNPVGRWFTNKSLQAKQNSEIDLTKSFAVVNHANTYQQLKILIAAGTPQQFQSLDNPIEIILGTNTFNAVKKSAALWQGIFKQVSVHKLPNTGHLPIQEAPDAIANILFAQY